MVVTTPLTIMPPTTCDNYKAKKWIMGHIWPHRDLVAWPFNLRIWCVHPCPKVQWWWKFCQIPPTNTQDILLTMFVRDSRTHAWTDTQTHKHSGNIMPPAATMMEA